MRPRSLWHAILQGKCHVRCSVLLCVAVCCGVLQCVAVCCSLMQSLWHVILEGRCQVRCSVLPCVAVCCSVLQCVAESLTRYSRGQVPQLAAQQHCQNHTGRSYHACHDTHTRQPLCAHVAGGRRRSPRTPPTHQSKRNGCGNQIHAVFPAAGAGASCAHPQGACGIWISKGVAANDGGQRSERSLRCTPYSGAAGASRNFQRITTFLHFASFQPAPLLFSCFTGINNYPDSTHCSLL